MTSYCVMFLLVFSNIHHYTHCRFLCLTNLFSVLGIIADILSFFVVFGDKLKSFIFEISIFICKCPYKFSWMKRVTGTGQKKQKKSSLSKKNTSRELQYPHFCWYKNKNITIWSYLFGPNPEVVLRIPDYYQSQQSRLFVCLSAA